MADRKVEADVVVNDRSDAGITSLERKMRRVSDSAKKTGNDAGLNLGKGLINGVGAFSPKLAAQLTNAFEAAGSAAGPVLAASLVAVSPLIGASISGAVLGGAGAGGVIGGILLASRDARVQTAGAALGQNLLTGLEQKSSTFIEPIMRAFDEIDATVTELDGNLSSIFANASRYVEPLTRGLTNFLEPVIRGLDEAIAAAGPAIAAIESGLGEVGDAVGSVFHDLSDNGEEAGLALAVVFHGIAESVRLVGTVINGLTEAFGFLADVAEKVGATKLFGGEDELAALREKMAALNESTVTTTSGFERATDVTYDYEAGVKAAQDAIKQLTEDQQSLYDATTNVGKAYADAREALKDNGKTLSANSEKGRENRKALSDLATALRRQYEETLAVNGEGPRTQRIADGNRQKFISMAHSMGLSSAAARDLADKILGIPASRRSKIEVATAQALSAADELKKRLAGIKDRRVYVDVAFNEGRLINVERRLARVSNENAAGSSFAFNGQPGTAPRTGGPAPVSVTSTIENRISLDGRPFRDYVDRAVTENSRRESFRARVGQRR